MSIFLLVLGLVLFVGLVVVHELGHFIVARRNGVEAEEFGIGFPPRFYKRRIKSKKGDYDFTLNGLPVGGFVKLKGEHDADTAPGSFGRASLKAKAKILLAGVGVNLLVALVLFTVVAWLGMPRLITKANFGENQFTIASDTKVVKNQTLAGQVAEGSPAAKAGLQPGDRLVSVSNGQETTIITSAEQLPEVTGHFAGQTVNIAVVRGNRSLVLKNVTLNSKEVVEASRSTDNPVGYLGVVPSSYIVQRSTWSAPIVAVGLSAQLTKLTFGGLGTAMKGLGSLLAGLFTGNRVARQTGQTEATAQVSGPLGIFFVLKEGANLGIVFMMFIIAVISLTLAIMNVLPIPALDGGRLYMILWSRLVNKRPLKTKTEERWVGSSFAFLLVLIVLITVVDVQRFF